jgi:Tfp pilus assembly protein PilX
MEHQSITTQKGFAMLFTVLIISLILSIAIGISNLTLRQSILSSLAKDSGIAFYQADAAVECGMFQDTEGNFPIGTTVGGDPLTNAKSSFDCGGVTMVLDTDSSTTDYIKYVAPSLLSKNVPCFSILFDKTTAALSGGKSAVRGAGYSTCTQGPRQVERLLQVTY